jgi:hypothetical protein
MLWPVASGGLEVSGSTLSEIAEASEKASHFAKKFGSRKCHFAMTQALLAFRPSR